MTWEAQQRRLLICLNERRIAVGGVRRGRRWFNAFTEYVKTQRFERLDAAMGWVEQQVRAKEVEQAMLLPAKGSQSVTRSPGGTR